MLGCQITVSSKKCCSDWKCPSMVARAVSVTMLTEVGDDWAGRQHEPADSGMVARCM